MKEKYTAPSYPWYPSDFAGSSKVRRMTLEERGAYHMLLDVSWEDGFIPSDVGELARLLGVAPARMARLWNRLKVCFVEESPGRMVNERIEEIREQMAARAERRRRAGSKGAESRWQSDSNANSNRISESSQCQRVPIPSPSPIPTDKRESLRTLVESAVEIWNSSCGSFPKIRTLTDKRRVHIRARAASRNGTFEDEFRQVIEAAKSSEFCLKGSWFTFDWLVSSETNWAKVIEGNYQEKSPESEPDPPPEPEEQRRARAEAIVRDQERQRKAYGDQVRVETVDTVFERLSEAAS